ncbi:MAG: 2-amino-4-hydroxy-6-hydroxymethyldihydropteridine diphosphokinase [Spartobacteria bacterium]|nr:2-amino-4-hydroxy-6-hydroxymethyldihydropteridine diphosphokinase [Spartobacteria bacterium]
METAFSLGTNMGDRQRFMREARDHLLAQPQCVPAGQSLLYETEPVGVAPEHQDKLFLNAVLIVEAPIPAAQWLEIAQGIEYAMGRRRSSDRNAPRPIDIDLLYVGDDCIDSASLVLPHPRWAEREFVVRPLADIRPDRVLPGMCRSVREQLARIATSGTVRLFARQW